MPDEGDKLFEEAKKKGPGGIPVWGYGVGIAGVIVLFMFLKGSSSSSTSGQDTSQTSPGSTQSGQAPQTGTGTTYATGGGYGDGYGGGWMPPFYTIGGNNGQVTPPVTNDQWARIVEDWLVSRGVDPQLVGDAVDDYIHHQTLDQQEAAVVGMAVTGWGTPPQGTFRIITGPKPIPGPPPPSPTPVPPGPPQTG